MSEEKCCYAGIAHDCHAGEGCRIAERMKAATPPQRTWVGLTREEILEARWHNKSSYRFARVLEATLKERNT